MNYLRYSSIIMILFVFLILIGSSSASELSVENIDLESNTLYQSDSINTQSSLIDLNSLNISDLDKSKKSGENIGSSEINKVNAISGNTFNDIQNAIDNAKNGDKIILNNITYYGTGSCIFVNKSINIIGNGAILNARGLSYIMRINVSHVNLSDIRFVNGYTESVANAGALMLIENSKYCTVSNCLFRNDTGCQGAVYVTSTYSKFLNCNFTNNKGIIVVDNITYKNTARMSGGLNLDGTAAYGYVSGCIFEGNAGRSGGGASLRGDYNTIENCTFKSNIVNEGISDYSYAGALHVGPNNGSSSTASVLNCLFINNSVYNKNHEGHAGALCFEDGSIMDNCTFINNYCEGAGGATTLHGSGVISNCKFINCTATVSGGAIYTGLSHLPNSWVNFTNCYFSGNAAPKGGAVSAVGNGISFYQSTFLENSAVNGGAVYVEGDKSFFSNLTVLNNFADMGGAFYVKGNNVLIINTVLDNNSANLGGGFIIIGNNSNLNNLNISYNVARYGGGIYINGSNTLVSNVIFSSNQATPIQDTPYNDSHMDDGLGGGAFINGVNSTFENTVFSFNSARNGSGVYLSGSKMIFNNVSTDGPNKAWSYLLPLSVVLNSDGTVRFNITHYGGNNINGGNQSTNYIYLNASNNELIMDGLTPKTSVENSNNGSDLFKDNREQYQNINIYLIDEEGNISGDFSGLTDLYGTFSNSFNISSLQTNVLYTINAIHSDDTFYTYVANSSSFTIPEPLVNKNANKEVVFKDELINYTLVIENIAPLESYFLVTDILPDYFVYQGTNLTPLYEDFVNNKIIWNVSISPQTKCIINLWGYSNKTNINLTNIVEVYNPEANKTVTDNNTIVVLPEANLNISSVFDKLEINKGSNLTLTINVTNNGPDSAYDLIITDLFDSDFVEFISCNDSRFNPITGDLNLDVLEPNDTFSFNITVNINGSNTIINNLANVFSPTNNSNHIPNDCSTNISALVLPQANLVLNISTNSSDVNIDDVVCWIVDLTNIGPDTAKDVVLLDLLDFDNLEFISCNDSRFNIESNTLYIGDMDFEDILSFEVYTKVIKSGVNITDWVNVYSPTNNSDCVANNISDSITIKSKPVIDIQVNKSSNYDIAILGDEIIWTITIINNGLNTAHNVYAIDEIPQNLKFISYITNVGTYDSISGLWNIGDLVPNYLCTLSINTKCIGIGNITNIVSVYSDETLDDNAISTSYTIEVLDIPIYEESDESNKSENPKNNFSQLTKNIPMESSGNPLILLIYTLLICGACRFQRKF